MEQFKEYLIDEYKDRAKGYVAVEFKFTHSITLKKDKETDKPLKFDIIKVSIRFVDKNMNVLYTTNISFENNVIPKNKQKLFINISPKELNNKFNFAKKEIIRTIMTEYVLKRDDLNDKINNLQMYSGNDPYGGCAENDVIKPLFKGKIVNVVDNDPSGPAMRAVSDVNDKNKTKFDM